MKSNHNRNTDYNKVYPLKKRYAFHLLFAFGLTIAGGVLIKQGFQRIYPQLLEILIGVILLGASIVVACKYLWLRKIEIVGDKLIIRNLYDKELCRVSAKELEFYTFKKTESKYGNEEKVVMHTHFGKYTFRDTTHANFYMLTTWLKGKASRNKTKELSKNVIWATVISLVLAVFGTVILVAGNTKYVPITKDKISLVKATLLEEPVYYSSRRGSGTIEMKLREYPELEFKISCDYVSKNIVDDFQAGDAIKLQVLREDYEKKLAKTQPLSFWDKSWQYKFIQVKGLGKNKKVYYTFEDVNFEKKDSLFMTVLINVVGLLFVGLSIYVFWEATKKFKKEKLKYAGKRSRNQVKPGMMRNSPFEGGKGDVK